MEMIDALTIYTIMLIGYDILESLMKLIIYNFKIYLNIIHKDFAKQRYNTPYACNVI